MPMKYLSYIIVFCLGVFLLTCATPNTVSDQSKKEEPVVIANDSLEYEIIIIDLGFNNYLNTIARPVGFYSQQYLENRNQFYVAMWNARVNNPFAFDPNIYENIIDYDSNIDYGYEVNYKLFNYFEFAQRKYRMRLR